MKQAFRESDITNNLAELRKRRGWSASVLAMEIGVSRQAIYAIEAGTYMPNTALSLRLAQGLGVSISDIFQLKKQQQPARSVEANLIAGHASLQPGQCSNWPV